MTGIRIGYARCSTDKQDLAAQHQAQLELDVDAERMTPSPSAAHSSTALKAQDG